MKPPKSGAETSSNLTTFSILLGYEQMYEKQTSRCEEVFGKIAGTN